MRPSLAITLNAIGLYGIALVLAAAYAAQVLLDELPCPLCLLQRFQFTLLAIGPILNIRFGPRPAHYGCSLLAAAAGAAFAMRQILLHIQPGDPGYGSALLGYHYYTWAFIGFAVAIVLIAAMLLAERQFYDDDNAPDGAGKAVAGGAFARVAVWLVIGLIAANAITTLLECGFGACPDNPVEYELLKRRTPAG
jgi:disulfide bond formation protein DsbB